MAITFTSNQVATKFVKDASGFAGAADFSANANFAKDVYFNANGDSLQAEDVLTTSRDAAIAYTSQKTDWSEVLQVPAGKLRRAFIPDYQTHGVISNGSTSDFIQSPTAAAPYIPNTSTADTYALYAYKGKAMLSSADVTIISGDGSYQNPLIFKYLNNQLPPITRTEGATGVWCGYVIQGEVPFVPYFVQTPTPPADLLSLNAQQFTGRKGSLVMRYVEPKRTYGTRSNQPILQVQHNATNSFDVIYRADLNDIRARFYKQGVEASFDIIASDVDLSKPNTIGLSWDNGLFTVSWNGVATTLVGKTMDTTGVISFTPSKITVLHPNTWLTNYNYAAVLNLITYKRALSKDELSKATNF